MKSSSCTQWPCSMPCQGRVAVIGPNGAGKSTMIKAGCTCHLSTFESLGTAVLCKHVIFIVVHYPSFLGVQYPILTFVICFHTPLDQIVCLHDWGDISKQSLASLVTPVGHFAPSVRPWSASCLSLANRLFGSIQMSGPQYFHPLHQKLDNGC